MNDLKDSLKVIINEVSYEDRLLQLAEECNELSQAILKWFRMMKGTNPPEDVDIIKNLNEELADVNLCLKTILSDTDTSTKEKLQENENYKLKRWTERLKESGND